MKFLVLNILFVSLSAYATKEVKLNSIGFGNLLHIDAHIQLPKGQKLNQGAPSKISVYEKQGNEWILTEAVKLNDFFSLTELIDFQRPVKLKSDKSEIKIQAGLYHCPRVGKGICVIDDFEGYIKRNPKKASSEVRVQLVGSNPS